MDNPPPDELELEELDEELLELDEELLELDEELLELDEELLELDEELLELDDDELELEELLTAVGPSSVQPTNKCENTSVDAKNLVMFKLFSERFFA